ncbi:TPA: hypothetical protein ACNZS7_001161 [Streptococcus pyogenes]|uniref:hypothetical protein n=1 Tax=Streptococcus pyogenes TaxID=1314 RepID=UPI00109CC50E|nr:hypothetical protein [Streptococcus pyogenes]VHB69180.1 Uncharacterised protein [Streptococcus pyogenes]VHN08578.1 Uncharacterised protein [Streptococcus pyogenes]HEP1431842.1 hypothetical protein [Streptococcus pyogenes]HEQ9903910.1 hypothetical protein [Streptococcus pyogenes]HEQ9929557.1 hypothetical protein [Streptococcus pyogenes]
MKQQSYQPLRFVYLLVALFAAMLLVARPVMADEEDNDPWKLGYNRGLIKGKEDGQKATWTDLTPPDPTIPEDLIDSSKIPSKEGYTDGYRDGYNESWKSQHPVLTPVKVIWDLISHWLQRLFPNNQATTTVQSMS